MKCARIMFLWLAVVLVSGQNVYCSPGGNQPFSESDNFTVFEYNGKVGLKNDAGEILIPATYDAIGWSDARLAIIDKVVGYKLDGLWGLIHMSNRLVTPAEFTRVNPAEGSFLIAQKKSPLSQRPVYGVINTSGKAIIPFIYDGLTLSHMRAIVMSRAGTKFQFGLTDLNHKILIPLQYQRIYSLGSLRFGVENFSNKTAIFADDGHPLTRFTIDSISAFKNDYAVVHQDQRQGLINRNGQFVLQPTYAAMRFKEDGTIEMRDTDTWFLLDGKNNRISTLQAEAVDPLSPGHYAVINGKSVALTNNDFQTLRPDFFSSVTDFDNGIALFKNAGKTGVLTKEAKILIAANYQQLIIDHNMFRACLATGYDNRWTILDNQGNEVTKKHYEYIAPCNGKFFPVRSRGYWGAVGLDGKEIITCVHDSIVQQEGSYVVVKFKGEYGIINLNENWVVTPQPSPLAVVNDEMYFVYAGKTTFLKAMKGGIIYFSDNVLEPYGANIRETLPSGAYRIIDRNGMMISRSKQPEDAERVFPEHEGFRAIRKDGKFGFIDSAGRLRIANRYDGVQPFSNGRAAIRIRDQWGFIDGHEKLVVQPVYDSVNNFRNGYAIVTQDDLTGLLDHSGKVILPLRYDEITVNTHNRFLLRQGSFYGLADDTGTVIIHPKYDRIVDIGDGYVIVQRDDKFGLLTLGGVSTIPMIYDGLIFDPHHNHYMAVKKSPWKTFGQR